ncbi:DAK2 domain-containing protein [Lawsonibacter faecis]|uniref:DAK2 domain-containing protein n=1 Tax=Lawsonibacter faecis TaxID=2763052 RepID=A0A8J6JMM8_9FIRM|nr:DAK2 domain-containing protein [Lawsonibacter faecis]MBC5738084.1 DAK2 domain-containing protein [Lawsonibacter faecis]
MRETIDGASFQRMVIHAAASINIQKQHINELNVFPVPDGDTGTNMGLTISTAAAEMKKAPLNTVGEAAGKTASALLRGARGNSGVILSLLFRGFAKAVKEKDTIDGRDLAVALDFGVAAAYKAVMKPAEGTILTVSRLAAAQAAATARENNNAEAVLEAAIREGRVALDDTINQNPVLKKAGVVDAGGKGFLVILQGMLDELRGEPIPEGGDEAAAAPKDRADFERFSTEEIQFGYCTEFICSRDNKKKDPEALRGFLSALGDSLVLVDDDEIIKVHVHTNNPGRVLEEAITYGALQTVKIENMRNQHSEILEEAHEAHQEEAERKVAAPEKKYGFVSVCAGDGLAEVFRDLGVDGVISGGQTMNPSTEDILREIDRTPAEIVFVLPNNKNIIMAAQQCVPLAEGKKVIVLPSKTVPQGISAMLSVDPDAGEEENVSAMTEALGRVSTSEITYAARDSDFDGFAITQGDYLALAEHQLFGTDRDIHVLLERLAQAAPQQEAEFITIFYGEDVQEAEAQKTLELFRTACPKAEITLLAGGQPVYYYMISAE